MGILPKSSWGLLLTNFLYIITVLLAMSLNIVHFIPTIYFPYNWKFVHFDRLLPVPPSSPPLLAITRLLFFFSFFPMSLEHPAS